MVLTDIWLRKEYWMISADKLGLLIEDDFKSNMGNRAKKNKEQSPPR
jgi:hypothetical protein